MDEDEAGDVATLTRDLVFTLQVDDGKLWKDFVQGYETDNTEVVFRCDKAKMAER